MLQYIQCNNQTNTYMNIIKVSYNIVLSNYLRSGK